MMYFMSNLVAVTYTPVERGGIPDAETLVKKYLAAEIPAFVIANAGLTLEKSLKATGVKKLLIDSGYDGDDKNRVEFNHSENVLAADLSDLGDISGDEWALNGVTSLHSDKHRVDQASQVSLNHTRRGQSEFRLHQNRLQENQLDDQWDVLDTQTAILLRNSEVNPALMSPEGFIARIATYDLLVFDPSNIHMVRSLTSPRIAEATFFEKTA